MIFAVPVIQKIENKTNFGFVVLKHSDVSSCSLQNRSIVIDAHSSYVSPFLFEVKKSSLELRPIYYRDPKTFEKYMLTDELFAYAPDRINQAYEHWKYHGMKKIDSSKKWLEQWIGKDLVIEAYSLEVFGYLIDWSRVIIKNAKHNFFNWIKFAKGVFSEEMLELVLEEHKNKGVYGTMRVMHGEGGVCINGAVEKI